jgi:NADPH-dependent curcumin reductase CurA
MIDHGLGMSKTHYLGALGLTGLTAYFGLTEVVNTTKDDIVVISGAAGATGMMAVQIAKHIIGCKKVIGMAGSDEKCKWVESLGADLCLNCKSSARGCAGRHAEIHPDKSSSFKEDLKKATLGPDNYANVYFDNVGGEILDFMLTRMAKFGRVSCCGAISNYNSSGDTMVGVKNWFEVITMRLMCKGFIVLDCERSSYSTEICE